ncbi:MAG: phospho-N-acetylmuramoyl-pentapeptide-transferase [Candidatus Saccharibacteria bacterium]|nr:phospho-N-acetylmuramoyl-pentapeptide-transferase [Candidatus Saccharibacteria bacterium]
MTEILTVSIQTSTVIRILALAALSFMVSMAITPIYTTAAYKYQWWKRQRSDAWSGGLAKVYQKLHAAKHKRNIPTMAGVIFVVSVSVVTLLFNLDRGQTWLPLAGMVGAGIIGLIDDYINIRGQGLGIAGMRSKIKFALHSAVALIGGWWFFARLDVSSISVPVIGELQVGFLVIALFWFIVVATANAVNITDGLDGLAGGLLVSSFAAYTLICFMQGQYALAGFCLTIVGALLSYTWFNIYPARFFMGDVGSFALGTALGIIAMQTDTIFILPVIGAVYVAETGSVIINRLSRKIRNGKKVFKSSPIHHHFEASGWPETKITMRFWILGQVAAVIGLILFVVGGL